MSAEAIGWGRALVHRLLRVRFRRTGGRPYRIIMSDPVGRAQTVTGVKDRHGLPRSVPGRRGVAIFGGADLRFVSAGQGT